ncbi:MAG: EAL domain-containing protein [Desulfoplanes sp.]|nr:EAL domain-containing protein [Desulfoplanes sp.]MDD4649262.1 EAL domain-containing protein [Desulfoplanes sp.]
MHKVVCFSEISFPVRTHKLDGDTLLRRMGIGFCMGDCNGRIHASNRQFHTFFGYDNAFFLTWWKKTASNIQTRKGYVSSEVVLVEEEFTLPGNREHTFKAWIFFLGTVSRTACLFFKDMGTGMSGRHDGVSDFGRTSQEREIRKFNDSIFRALQNNEFSILYQPILDIRSGRIAGFDAQLRGSHLAHEEIASSHFMDLLETTGASLPLGIWFMGNICQQVQRWNQERNSPGHYCVHLNMSLNQLGSASMLGALQAMLDAYAIDPSWLWIENSKATFDCQVCRKSLLFHRYHAMGVNFVVDDLRISLADLSYFFRFSVIPFKAVKIVESLHVGEDKKAAFESFTTFVKIFSSLGILVVAKGLGNTAGLSALRQTCCRYAQGNDASSFLRADEAIDVLSQQDEIFFS